MDPEALKKSQGKVTQATQAVAKAMGKNDALPTPLYFGVKRNPKAPGDAAMGQERLHTPAEAVAANTAQVVAASTQETNARINLFPLIIFPPAV